MKSLSICRQKGFGKVSFRYLFVFLLKLTRYNGKEGMAWVENEGTFKKVSISPQVLILLKNKKDCRQKCSILKLKQS